MNADLIGDGVCSGVLPVCKPSGMTSHDVVAKIRRFYGTRKVGHTGTLDPMATGLLIVLVGTAVKACDMVTAKEKSYVAEMKLGLTTDTADITGRVLSSCAEIPAKAEVVACAKGFLGKYMQMPPMYSAIKVGGKKLCDLAREGKTVELEPREVFISSLDIDGDGDTYGMNVTCSKGTYIRTLCEDVGKKLGCGAVMSALERTGVGSFTLDDAKTLEEIEAMTQEERVASLIPTENLFSNYKRVELPEFYRRLCLNGCEIYQRKIRTDFPLGTLLRVYGAGEFIGVGEVKDFPDGTAIKLIARFV